MPLVSALIPTYNRAERVGGAVETVLNQTHDDVEAVVVVDGSTDDTESVLAAYADDDRVRVRVNEENRGISYSFNRAAAVADGEFYCILGDDDRWHPEKVERQLEKFASLPDDFGVVYTGGVLATEEGRVTRRYRPDQRGDLYPDIFRGFHLHPHSSHMIRARDYDAVGGFDPDFPRGVDWEMTVRLAKRCKFDYLPEVLVRRTFHGSNISDEPEQLDVGRYMWKKYREEMVEYPDVAHAFLASWYLAKSRIELRHDRNYREGVRSAAKALHHQPSANAAIRFVIALTGPTGLQTAALARRAGASVQSTLLGGYDEGTGW
ncbi:glycosyltransferase family 2 protein [Halobium salinum]|uniref:Glycosyltransferase family 2 protein n=1 Tax=Halobium salinum TaxID=1364940 RepID=A0ABD5PCH2_9EURY|nr:glycosyltransferase [Halobium salinum]